MPSIKLTALRVNQPPFRKLANLEVQFADRLTIIAGHNGIGKSTIMALIANASGLSKGSEYRTLSGRLFEANIFDIVYLDYKAEYLERRSEPSGLPAPQVDYVIQDGGTTGFTKSCSITGRSGVGRLRVVPRNHPLKDVISSGGRIRVGRDAKVPLPTIYLGMTRMLPVGEANPNWVDPKHDVTVERDEADFISRFINTIVPGSRSSPARITSLGIRGTGKVAKHPHYMHDVRSISLGQDSLGSIATALASFQRLKRKWGDYPGGLLVIDELDAGLHPHAQGRLIDELRATARRLDLQIVATTHSTHLIEAVHPQGAGHARAPDGVVYLVDSTNPRIPINWSLDDVLGDMSLRAPSARRKATPQKIKIYFEDDEAAFVFNQLVTPAFRRTLKAECGVGLNPMPLGVGCSNLLNLPKHDTYFRSVLLVVDADVSVPRGMRACVLKLPGATDRSSGKGLPPERTLYEFISLLVDEPLKHEVAFSHLDERITGDQLRAHMLNAVGDLTKRDTAKKWWRDRKAYIEEWRLWQAWAAEHKREVADFHKSLTRNIAKLVKRMS